MDSVLTALFTTVKPLPAAENPLIVMLRFLVGIAVVFLLMWLLYRWFKRTNLGDYEGPGLRLVSRLQLSRSSQVALVEIGGRMFLVGAGDSTVTPIAEIYDTEEMSAQLNAAAQSMRPTDAVSKSGEEVKKPFGQVLSKMTKAVKPAAGRPQTVQASPGPSPKVTEAQMDALAAQIAAEFGVKKSGEAS